MAVLVGQPGLGETLIWSASATPGATDHLCMDEKLPPLTEVLGRLPWYGQLTDEHRANMLAEFSDRLLATTSRDEFTKRLREWATVAHADAKWARFRLLQDSGLLPPNKAA